MKPPKRHEKSQGVVVDAAGWSCKTDAICFMPQGWLQAQRRSLRSRVRLSRIEIAEPSMAFFDGHQEARWIEINRSGFLAASTLDA
ncbi:MAG: hypothetical protein B0D91_02495 [Oceanospirillales bacterium LUC14_002_19_P2]|nr:MAG: hypothetical protein B0D91_02495 [Oceanospirillales bacterium LUC14_002_19_P2]